MNHPLRAALSVIPLTLMLCAAAPAQEQGHVTTTTSSSTHQARRGEPLVVTLKFHGGSMAALVEAVRENQPKANIVLSDLAARVQVPEMELKGAGIDQALEGACSVASSDEGIEVRVKEYRGEGEPVFSIIGMLPRTKAMMQAAGVEVLQRVMSLSDLIGKQPQGVQPLPVRTILSAIELAVQGEQSPPRVRFHEDSGLLLVRGQPQHVQLVQEVLATLRNDLEQQAQRQIRLHNEEMQRENEQRARQGRESKGQDR